MEYRPKTKPKGKIEHNALIKLVAWCNGDGVVLHTA